MKIPIAEFRANDIKESPMKITYVEYKDGCYYYIAYNGNLGKKYKSLEEAKGETQSLWGDWCGFKLLDTGKKESEVEK